MAATAQDHAAPPTTARTNEARALSHGADGASFEADGASFEADGASFEAVGDVEQPIAAGTDLDPTSSATTIEVRGRLRALESTDELLLEVPGARPRSWGAAGAVSSVALRGTEGRHTAVLLGDIPLTLGDDGGFDLSLLPPSLLERIDVYRGGAPAWLSAGAIGGVLLLTPRGTATESSPTDATGANAFGELTVGAGSFGLAETQIGGFVDPAPAHEDGGAGGALPIVSSTAGVRHSDGDFPFEHNNNTPLDPTDDFETARSNGRLDEGYGLLHTRSAILGGRFEGLAMGHGRAAGVPGPAVQQTLHARRSTALALVGVSYVRDGELSDGEDADPGAPEPEAADAVFDDPGRTSGDGRPGRPWRTQVLVSASYDRQRLADPYGEVGSLARVTDDRTARIFARAAAEAWLSDAFGAAAVATYQRESHDPDDALARVTADASERHIAAITAEPRLRGRWGQVRTELRASARVELSAASLVETRTERRGETSTEALVAPTFRIAGVLAPAPGLAITTSLSSGMRRPSFLELFGDRAFLLGDTRLRPEWAKTLDLGASLRGRAGLLRGRADVHAFATQVEDLIRYTRTNLFQSVPQNEEQAVLLGVEVSMAGRLGPHLGLTSALTVLDARDSRDRLLPLRSPLSAYVRPELSVGGVGLLSRAALFVDASHVGESFADAANLIVIPSRTKLGSGVVLYFGDSLTVSMTARDLLDARGQDYLGFPLPGRTLSLSASLRP